MPRKISIGAAALAFPFIACGGSHDAASIGLAVPMDELNDGGRAAAAVLRDRGEQTEITLVYIGGSDRGAEAAHIHLGRCGSFGPIVHPLNNVQEGMSVTTINARLSALMGGRYYINIHNSENPAHSEACGIIP